VLLFVAFVFAFFAAVFASVALVSSAVEVTFKFNPGIEE